MSILTIAWSMCGAASLMLGLMHIFLWFHERHSTVYLLTALASCSAAASAMLELSLMHTGSTTSYGELVRWQNLVVFMILIPLVWAVHLHLGTGRRWLALLITALWTIGILINFASPGSLTFLEIQALKRLPTFWGETFVFAEGVRNPWATVADVTSILIFIFFTDAAIGSWRLGRHRRALAVGIGAGGFILIGGVHAPLVDAGVLDTPYMVSFAFLTMVLAMSYELVADSVRASLYAREIEASNKRWQALLAHVELSVLGIDPEGRINYVNPYFERTFGYRAEELLGRPATSLVPENDAAELEYRLQVAADTGPRPHSQWTLLRRSGEQRQLLLSSVRQETSEGRFDGVLTIGEDVTDRLKAEHELSGARREMERLMRANMLGELASALAHELNQPLAAILSNVQAAQRLLQSDALGPQELQEILDDIVRDDRRASGVIARMRSMVRKGEVQAEPVQINTAVREVVELMQGDLEAQDIDLDLFLTDDLPLVFASQLDLQQVVMNLVMNAMRAVTVQPESQRLVTIVTTQTNERIRLSVEDSGPGISQEVTARMFEPFFTTKPLGIGMGLAICRRIVDAHSGRIWAENQNAGGTRISVELPLMDAVQKINA